MSTSQAYKSGISASIQIVENDDYLLMSLIYKGQNSTWKDKVNNVQKGDELKKIQQHEGSH